MIYIKYKGWEKIFVMYMKRHWNPFKHINKEKKTMENWANDKNNNSEKGK